MPKEKDMSATSSKAPTREGWNIPRLAGDSTRGGKWIWAEEGRRDREMVLGIRNHHLTHSMVDCSTTPRPQAVGGGGRGMEGADGEATWIVTTEHVKG
mmetsp:Transcript_37363/g.62885  ORF Transcript_37363/g.62885 Transcript_37363/m.62885 type:complete len:98 (+) Transcript_37363:131-424(+)